MASLILLMKMIVCLVGGVAVGRWFLSKAREGHVRGDPWYKVYISSVPGLIIVSALILLPLILWFARSS